MWQSCCEPLPFLQVCTHVFGAPRVRCSSTRSWKARLFPVLRASLVPPVHPDSQDTVWHTCSAVMIVHCEAVCSGSRRQEEPTQSDAHLPKWRPAAEGRGQGWAEGHTHDVMRILIELLLVHSLLIYSLGGLGQLIYLWWSFALDSKLRLEASTNTSLSPGGVGALGIGRHDSLLKSYVAVTAVQSDNCPDTSGIYFYFLHSPSLTSAACRVSTSVRSYRHQASAGRCSEMTEGWRCERAVGPGWSPECVVCARLNKWLTDLSSWKRSLASSSPKSCDNSICPNILAHETIVW